MADDEELLPIPATTVELFGHREAEDAFLRAFKTDRLHHAWLLSGPQGIGKTSFAYQIARFLLSRPSDDGLFGDIAPAPETLAIPSSHPIAQRIAAGGHADLRFIDRPVDPKTGKRKQEIPVDSIRSLTSLFQTSASEGGWRVTIIDDADLMNRNAANALLKMLEEPPQKAILILVSHAPGRLLPTIRSRCRQLTLRPLDDSAMAGFLASIDLPEDADRDLILRQAAGRPGRVRQLINRDWQAMASALQRFLSALGREGAPGALFDLAALLAPAKAASLFGDCMELLVADLRDQAQSIACSSAPDRFLLEDWLVLCEKTAQRATACQHLYLDRRAVLLALGFEIDRLAKRRQQAIAEFS